MSDELDKHMRDAQTRMRHEQAAARRVVDANVEAANRVQTAGHAFATKAIAAGIGPYSVVFDLGYKAEKHGLFGGKTRYVKNLEHCYGWVVYSEEMFSAGSSYYYHIYVHDDGRVIGLAGNVGRYDLHRSLSPVLAEQWISWMAMYLVNPDARLPKR